MCAKLSMPSGKPHPVWTRAASFARGLLDHPVRKNRTDKPNLLHRMRCTKGEFLQTPASRCTVALTLLAFLSVAVTPARPETYPARSVKLVTQGAAGSGPDVVVRLVTDQLARMWGQQVVV